MDRAQLDAVSSIELEDGMGIPPGLSLNLDWLIQFNSEPGALGQHTRLRPRPPRTLGFWPDSPDYIENWRGVRRASKQHHRLQRDATCAAAISLQSDQLQTPNTEPNHMAPRYPLLADNEGERDLDIPPECWLRGSDMGEEDDMG